MSYIGFCLHGCANFRHTTSVVFGNGWSISRLIHRSVDPRYSVFPSKAWSSVHVNHEIRRITVSISFCLFWNIWENQSTACQSWCQVMAYTLSLENKKMKRWVGAHCPGKPCAVWRYAVQVRQKVHLSIPLPGQACITVFSWALTSNSGLVGQATLLTTLNACPVIL